MKGFLRSTLPSVVVGLLVGFLVLGIGGRIMMRIIAHWEGRDPILSPGGTFTVVMMGTIAGTAAGLIYGLIRRFMKNTALQIASFFLFCVSFTLYGVKEILVRPKLLFVGLTLVFCTVVTLAMRQKRRETAGQ